MKREADHYPALSALERGGSQEAQEDPRRHAARAFNMYSTGPFFRTYFEALGLGKSNVVWSDATTEETWVEGGKYGSIDPCFPSKVVQSHIHNLLFHKHEPERNKALNYIFFPILTHVNNFVVDTQDNASCPIVAGTPDVTKAAFTKEVDFFAVRNMEYLDPALSFEEPTLLARRMFETWQDRLGDHRRRERPRLRRSLEGAQSLLDLRPAQDKGPSDFGNGRSRRSHRDFGAEPPVPRRSGPQSRHSGRVPSARLPDLEHSLDPEGLRIPRPLLQGTGSWTVAK